MTGLTAFFITITIALVVLVVVAFSILGTKILEAERRSDELLKSLYELVLIVDNEVKFTDQSGALSNALDDARLLSIAHDPFTH